MAWNSIQPHYSVFVHHVEILTLLELYFFDSWNVEIFCPSYRQKVVLEKQVLLTYLFEESVDKIPMHFVKNTLVLVENGFIVLTFKVVIHLTDYIWIIFIFWKASLSMFLLDSIIRYSPTKSFRNQSTMMSFTSNDFVHSNLSILLVFVGNFFPKIFYKFLNNIFNFKNS